MPPPRVIQFPIGDRVIAYTIQDQGGELVSISGPDADRRAALEAWADAEGMVVVPKMDTEGFSSPAPNYRPWAIGTVVRHIEGGWTGKIAGYEARNAIVERSQSWAEVVSLPNLVAVES